MAVHLRPVRVVKPAALAVIPTMALPSVRELFTVVRVNVAEVLPAAMVTVDGTVSRVGVPDASATVKFVTNVPGIETVPVPVPPSVTVVGNTRARVVVSLSRIATDALPSVQLATCAVTMAFCVPSILLSSTTVTVKLAAVWPAGIRTVEGTIAALVSLEVKPTTTGIAGAALSVTVPCTEPAPSVAEGGKVTARVAVSLSLTVSAVEPLT